MSWADNMLAKIQEEDAAAPVTIWDAQQAMNQLREGEKMKRRVEDWARLQVRAIDEAAAFYRHRLTEFAKDFRASTGKAELQMEGGVLRTRKAQARIEVDKAKILGFYNEITPERYPELFSTKPDLSALKKWVKWSDGEGKTALAVDPETGEIIPGIVRIVPQEGEVTVSISLDGQEPNGGTEDD